MMSQLTIEASTFEVVGQLIGFIFKDGYKIKYLRMKVSEREYWFKVPKELRQSLDPAIQPGGFLKITGIGKINGKNGKLELKADTIELTGSDQAKTASKAPSKPQKGKILVCQKSDCWKRGGKKICETLEQELGERGLGEMISIQRTGCLKKCKKAPNLVVLPEKVYYHQFDAQQVVRLLDSHFGN